MLLDQKLLQLMNEQLRNEFEAAYKYLGMAAYLETTPYKGMAHWMRVQSKEETEHAMKIFDYINSRCNHVELLPITNMPTMYNSPLDAFKEALKHEQLVTSLVNTMYKTAFELNDYASQFFLQWYITEQVEEEEQVQDIIDQIEAVQDSKSGIFAINSKLANR